MPREKGVHARFKAHTAQPGRASALSADHPAVIEGRPLFPGRVIKAIDTPRILVKGENNSKIGGLITKGPWKGKAVYTITLPERSTCPRSCAMWAGCYGNALQWPRRVDPLGDEDFIAILAAEVITVYRQHPEGIVVRLHVLGDFYSPAYVRAWGRLLEMLPRLSCYGYTARRLDGEPLDHQIAAELQTVADRFPDRWVVRTSHTEPGPGRTVVIDRADDPVLFRADVVQCPVETGATAHCGTCALCWSPNALDKTIAFTFHGMTRRTAKEPKRPRKPQVPRDEFGLTPAQRRLHAAMVRKADARALVETTSLAICAEAEVSVGNWGINIKALKDARLVQVVRRGRQHTKSVYRIFLEPPEELPPVPLLAAPPRKSPTHIRIADPRAPSRDAQPVAPRKPDAPLMTRRPVEGDRGLSEPLERRRPYTVKARHHPKTGALLNPHAIGSAANYDIGTAGDRVAGLPESEKERIARQYGATFKKERAE